MTKFKATRKLPDGTREDWTDEFLAINAKTLAKLPRKQRIAKPKHQLFNATKGPLAGHILDLSVDNGGAKTLMFTIKGETGFYADGHWYALADLATTCPDAWRAWTAPAPEPIAPAAAPETPPAPKIEPTPIKAPAKPKQPPCDPLAALIRRRQNMLRRAQAGKLALPQLAQLERAGLLREGVPTFKAARLMATPA